MAERTIQSAITNELLELNKRKERKANRTKGNWGNARVINQDVIDQRKKDAAEKYTEKNAERALKEWNKEEKRLRALGPNIFAPPRLLATPRRHPTAAAQIPPSTYEGHYANSSLRPVPNYVPRPRLHQKIKEQLHDLQDDGVEDVRILVVWGLGGAGKSQLVLNYIREYRRDYAAVFWIEAGSKESIERDYIQIYRLLYGRQMDIGPGMVKVEDAVPAVKRWFHGREGRWLVVLDSADTIDNDRDKSYIDLEYFLPDAPGVHIVITSRSSIAKEMTALEAVEVADMEPPEAVELFQRYAKIKEKGQDIATEVAQIVKELGYLALAITLAGSYVSVTPRLSSDIRRYLPEYRQRRKELLRQRAKRYIHQYRESVLSTWEVSFEAIKDCNPAAARLLSLLAFINFEDIFLGLFDRDCAGILASAPIRVTETLEATISPDETWRTFLFCGQKWTAYDLESAFETLQNYSLIQWKSDQGSYAMHKLVHTWGQDRLEADRQRRLSSLALELIADATAQDEIDPSHQLRLVPHVIASFNIFSLLQESLDKLTMGRLAIVYRMEDFLFRIGRWSEAYKMQAFHFRRTEKMLGKEHPNTLTSINNLALVLSSQGNYEEAERIDRQALALRERVLGKEHPDTLGSMNNLASVLSRQSKYEEAEKIYRQALALRERVLGKEHPSTLTSMNNLAEAELDGLNKQIFEQNLKDKFPRNDIQDCLIKVPTFIAHFQLAKPYYDTLEKDLTDEMAREKPTNINKTLGQVNERHGYPRTWLMTIPPPSDSGSGAAESSGATGRTRAAEKGGQASTKRGKTKHPDTGEQLTKADIKEMPKLSPDVIINDVDDEDDDEDDEDVGSMVPQRTGLKRTPKPKAASRTPEASENSRNSVESEL
ncbi:hypothetical protein OEA41_007835 [Lepraria neglecta]|uniref:NB-ARC domain-containing protein n=1 Tax=Lepraria neglecta TaxID=209136 RepID=A0AAD9ZDK5_9LECA|nr:hypothetical protein OEA41_007835 [Lepraria neglecta]